MSPRDGGRIYGSHTRTGALSGKQAVFRTGERLSRISLGARMVITLGGTHARQLQILQAASGMRREVGVVEAGRVHAEQSTDAVRARHAPGGRGTG